VDFVIVNTGQYVELESEAGITRIATLKKLAPTGNQTVFGGVLFTSASRNDIDSLHAELLAKDYKNAKPGVQDLPWGRMMDIADPFGNHLRFCQQTPD